VNHLDDTLHSDDATSDPATSLDDEFDDYVAVRPPSQLGQRVVYIMLASLVMIAIIGGFTTIWAMRQVDPPGSQGERIGNLEIDKGSTISAVSDLLESKGVITSASVFRTYAKLWGIGGALKFGTYTNFRLNSSMAEAAATLRDGPVKPDETPVTIVPGVRLVEALDAIAKAFPALTVPVLTDTLLSGRVTSKYLAAAPTALVDWEGLLAPDSYQFLKNVSADKILQKLADQQAKVMDGLGYERADALSGHSAIDLVKIASLVEKETGDPIEERGKIARVIDNRLAVNEPLGIDASILYGLDRRGGGLSKDDLAVNTPYNNRLNTGLPPTPIALPGKASLQAAIQPSDGDWRYYVLVSKNPSTHLFTSDYNEFLRAKDTAKSEGVF